MVHSLLYPASISSSLGNGTVTGSYRYDSWQLQFWDTFLFFKSIDILIPMVNSLTAIDAHERQLFDQLLWGLVTSTIFVRC
jgi:hypothetical protein